MSRYSLPITRSVVDTLGAVPQNTVTPPSLIGYNGDYGEHDYSLKTACNDRERDWELAYTP